MLFPAAAAVAAVAQPHSQALTVPIPSRPPAIIPPAPGPKPVPQPPMRLENEVGGRVAYLPEGESGTNLGDNWATTVAN